MFFDKKKVFYAFIAFWISLFLLFGAQQLFNRFVAFSPLIKTFSQKEYVREVNIKKEAGKINIEIYLKDVDNLANVYQDIQNTVYNILKGRPFNIRILNKPSEFLEDIYTREVQFIIFEGIKTGKFNEMRLKLDKLESKYKMAIVVFLDNENLYLKMKADNDVLYKIINMQ